jgi:PST family polysaccharide transporter
MLGQMINDRAVGLYSAARRISEVWMFVPIAITSSVAPTIISSKLKGNEIYYERVQKLFSLMSLFTIGIAIATALLSNILIPVIYGDEYQQASTLLSIQIWALIFLSWGQAQGPWEVNEGLLKQRLIRTVLGSFTAIVLNLILIPQYSAIGASISLLAASFGAHFLGNLLFAETRKIFWIELRSLVPVDLMKG